MKVAKPLPVVISCGSLFGNDLQVEARHYMHGAVVTKVHRAGDESDD